MFLVFPNFNAYSVPLLLLVAQGYFFAFLLGWRYVRQRNAADFFLLLLIFLQGHHCISYIIGFMDWYDTYPTTKINYFLLNGTFAIGPLVFFYVKSLITPYFRFKKKDLIHFLPFLIYCLYRLFLIIYDFGQPNFDQVQNGVLFQNFHIAYFSPFMTLLGYYSQLLYYAFSIDAYRHYRRRLMEYFSNPFKVELAWILNFLVVWTLLFIFHSIMGVINVSVVPLHWTQNWWSYIASAVVILYIGIKGFFTDLTQLYNLNFEAQGEQMTTEKTNLEAFEHLDDWKNALLRLMETERPYLNPDLTLADLAKQLNVNPKQLSQTINSGLNQNFKDFINAYRVAAVKEKLAEGKQSEYTLLSIALECGFNSKATFNRTFKKITDQTPSDYLKAL